MPQGPLSAFVGGAIDYGNQRRTFKEQKELAELNAQYAEQQAQADYERQLDFWNKQNEYNDPSQQVQRLKDAGLNPNAMLSGGGIQNVAGSAPATPTNQLAQRGKYTTSAVLPNMGDSIIKMTQAIKNLKDAKKSEQEIKNLMAEYDLTISQTKLQELMAVTESYNAEHKRQLGISQKIANEVAEATKSDDIQLKKNAVSASYKQIDLLTEQIDNFKAKTKQELAMVENLKAQRVQIAYQNAYLQVQARLAEANIHLTDAQVQETFAKTWSNVANTNISLAQWNIDSQTRGAQNHANLANTKMSTRMGYLNGITNTIDVAVSSCVDICRLQAKDEKGGKRGLSLGQKVKAGRYLIGLLKD